MDAPEFNKTYERDLAKANSDPMFRLSTDTIKRVFGNRFFEFRSIINKHDPVGLIASGASEDEYDPEVKSIIVQLDNKMTESQIHDLVYNEFLRWFGDESTIGQKESFKGLAKDIHDLSQTISR